MATLASTTYQCGWVPLPEPTVTLTVDPPTVLAPDGVIPKNTKISLDLRVNGVLTNPPNGAGYLFPSTTGNNDSDDYEGVRWSWGSDANGRFTYTILKGTVINDFSRTVKVPYEGNEYITTVNFARIDNQPGEPGKNGKDIWSPPPMQWSDYPTGYGFQAAEGDSNRLDTVIHGKAANGLLMVYRCIQSHSKGCGKNGEDEPGYKNSQYWAAMDGGPFHIVATQLLLAANAYIDLLTSNGVRVMKRNSTDKVSVLLSGGEYPILCGSTDPATAPTKIHEDGTFYSSKAVIEGDVVFGGRIKPMVTRITSANYTQYVTGSGDYDSGTILDFSKLTGRVILDASLNNVSESKLDLAFFVPSRYPDGQGWAKDSDQYNAVADCIGATITVRNDTSKRFAASGYVSTDPDLNGAKSVFLESGNEMMLECRLRLVSEKRAVGWYVAYRGPAV